MSSRYTPKKSLIIAGVPRSGKSILSRRLARALGLSHIPIDSLVSSFHDVFPETGISHSIENHEAICERLRPFLTAYLRHLDYEEIPLILDVWQLLPKDAVAIAPKDKFEIIYLGYPDVSIEEKCKQIRSSARPHDWTEEMEDPALHELVGEYITRARALRTECDRLGVRFIDTGDDFEASLDRAFRELLTLVGA